MSRQNRVQIGVIADTHGLLRPGAAELMRGSNAIIHAGDIGDPAIVTALSAIAPVTVVRGNVDRAPWASAFPATDVLSIGGALTYVLHDLADLDLDPAAAGFAAVITGHTHKPGVSHRDGVLYLNPGSAGPRRFSLPVTAAHLHICDGIPSATILDVPV